jgi:chromosome segregation ATPase
MSADNNIAVTRPASLVEKDGQVTISKEEFEKFAGEHDKWGKDAQTYAREAADRRVALDKTIKEFETKEQTFNDQIKDLQTKINDASDKSKDNPEVARLSRELAELKTEREKEKKEAESAREQARAEKVNARLASVISESKLNSPAEALELLRNKTRLSNDGVVEMRVKIEGKEEWVEATPENLKKHKALSDWYWPAEGGSGSGGQGGGTGTQADTGIDWSRIGDHAYYKEHAKEIDAALRKQKGG